MYQITRTKRPLLHAKITYNASAFSVPNNGGSDLTPFNFTRINDGCTVNLTNGSIQVPRAGYYMINCAVFWSGSSPGNRGQQFAINGVTYTTQPEVTYANSNASFGCKGRLSLCVDLAANDIITLRPWQDSGGSLTLATAELGVALIDPI